MYSPSDFLKERLRSLFKRRVRDADLAYLGDTHGAGARVDVPGLPGRVYVHFPNGKGENGFALYSPPQVVRSGVAAYVNTPGMPVFIAINRSGEPEIVDTVSSALDEYGIDTRVLNPLNQQSKFVYPYQLTYGLASAVANSTTTSFLVTIKSFRHYVGNLFQKVETPLAANKINLSAYIPTTDQHCYAAVWIDAYTNLPVVTTSIAQATTSPLTAADLQELVVRAASSRPADGIPLKAFYLSNSQGTITQSARDVDLRQLMDNPQVWGFPNVLTTLERVWPNRTLVTGPYTLSGVGAIALEAGAQHIIVHKGNLSATTDPTVNDDSGDGYSIGSTWFNKSTGVLYYAADVTVGAAVWNAVVGGGSSAPFVDTTAIVKGSADATKLLRFEVDGFTTATTRVMTPPNYDGTLATLAGTETLANKVLSQLHLLIGGFKAIFTHAFTADRTVTLPGDANVTLVGEATTQALSNKTINSSSIGVTTAAAGYFSALRLLIGGFFGIFTHTNTADRTYTLPNYSATLSPMTTQGDITYHNGTDNVRLAKGTALQHLRMNSGATAPEWANSLIVDWQAFSTPGGATWTKPANAKFIRVICIAAGSGGGSGRRGAAGVIRSGGGGGAAGGVTDLWYNAGELDATESVNIGAGGAGGAARTANDTSGAPGTQGGSTWFGGTSDSDAIQAAHASIAATGGEGAFGSTSASIAGGVGLTTLGPWLQHYGANGGGGVGTGTAGSGGVSAYGPGAGGGAAGRNAANVSGDGGEGGKSSESRFGIVVTGGGGTAGLSAGTNSGGNGAAGVVDGTSEISFGAGGGGGATAAAGGGGVGGNGGFPGGGGGGGGGSNNGLNSGRGGTGGDGCVIVISYIFG